MSNVESHKRIMEKYISKDKKLEKEYNKLKS